MNSNASNQQSFNSDENIIKMWLHGKSPHSQRMYRRVVLRFHEFTGKSLQEIGLQDVQNFDLSLIDLSDYSRKCYIAALKSYISFAHKIGHIPVNIGASIQPPKVKNTLAERILTEEEVKLMISNEPKDRNRILILFLYATGLRVSEACQLKWNDIQELKDGVIITVFGKGGKTRTIWISDSVWDELKKLKPEEADQHAVFRSQKRREGLDQSHVARIIKNAAKRVGIGSKVSPHWLRHAHASHSLDHGCPIHLVQKTLGHASIATTGTYLHVRPDMSSTSYLDL
jgi:integrase/recombinase XerD